MCLLTCSAFLSVHVVRPANGAHVQLARCGSLPCDIYIITLFLIVRVRVRVFNIHTCMQTGLTLLSLDWL